MIITLLLYGISFFLDMASGASNLIAKNYTIWPSNVIDGLTYFFTNLMTFNFLLNVYQMLLSIKWVVTFIVIYVLVRLFLKFINFVRGSGELDV